MSTIAPPTSSRAATISLTAAPAHAQPAPAAAGAVTLADEVRDDRVPRRARVSAFEICHAAAALAAEGGLTLATYLIHLPMTAALVVHLLIVATLAGSLFRRRAETVDLSAPLLTLIATSVAGPLGALVGVLSLAWLARPVAPAPLLQAWYDRIALSTTVDPETELSDRIASGRVLDTSAPPPLALVGIIRTGTLEERQAALGLIARFFHMNYLAALSDALSSDVPVIRVQAAAVAARIRPRLAEETDRRIAEAADLLRDSERPAAHDRSLQLVRELDQAIESGLIDKPVADAAAAIAARLTADIDCLALPLRVTATLEDMARLDAFERRLIATRQFARLRILRRRRRLVAHGFHRVRTMPRKYLAHTADLATLTEPAAGGA